MTSSAVAGPGDDARAPRESVADLVRRAQDQLTPSEQRIVGLLLDDYPMAGLQPVAKLAAAASVSPPTVLRLVAKLGFPGYADFREALRAEVANRLFSPLYAYPDPDVDGASPVGRVLLARAEQVLTKGMTQTVRGIDPVALERASELLGDPSRTVVTTGGKFSQTLAWHLYAYLRLLRGGVSTVAPEVGERERALLDIDERSVVAVFDYRRYQSDTIRFGSRARERGAALVLFTDTMLSPLAPRADAVLPAQAAGPSPFDALTFGFAVVEIVVAMLVESLGPAGRERLDQFERLQFSDDPV